jgi:NAD(P)-dependent dehydrogenase (short-subunit alcohol dehydrogenase family)
MKNRRDIMNKTEPTLLVTGGTKGIGAAVVRHATNKGWRVYAWGRDEESGTLLENSLASASGKCLYRCVDITNYEAVEREYQFIFNEGELSYAFNNAGVSAGGSLIDIEANMVRKCFNTNVFGLWANLHFQLANMIHAKKGVIVNNHSIHALRLVFPDVGIYSSSKAAGVMLTKAAALEAGSAGVRVNGISPGPIDTEMYQRSLINNSDTNVWPSRIPLNRIGTVDEVAETVMFLFSSKAAFINGQIIGIDGGASCY